MRYTRMRFSPRGGGAVASRYSSTRITSERSCERIAIDILDLTCDIGSNAMRELGGL